MLSTKDLVHISLFAAIVAVLGLIPKIQLAAGVPVTAQSMGVMLAGGILGARRGGLALLLFVALVLAGFPLLSGGRGGLGLLAGPSGGFLLAFPLGAFVTGYLVEKCWHKLELMQTILCTIIGGILVLYAVGIPWMIATTDFGGTKALMLMIPFLPGDIVKALIATSLILAVKKSWPLIKVDHSADR